jgi:hypothetical protein
MNAPTWFRWLKYRFFLPIISFLPLFIGYRLIAWIGPRYFFRYESNWVNNFRFGLKSFFADADESLIENWTRLHFEMMAKEELDVFHLSRMSAKNYQKWVTFDLSAIDTNTGGNLLLIGHFNRTILLSALGMANMPCGVLTTSIEDNPHLDVFMKHYLQKKMLMAINNMKGSWLTNNEGRRLYRLLHTNENMVVAIDVPGPKSIDFLNGKIYLSDSIFRLAKKTNVSLYYLQILDRRNSFFAIDVRAVKINIDNQDAFLHTVKYLEQDIIKYPWLWWQWNAFNALWRPHNE